MFMVNRFGWDFQTLAAMITPRALLIGNTDNDPIFPLPGVFRVHQQLQHVYQLQDLNKLGIQWTTGGHDDTQELQMGTFVWFDRFLQGERKPITVAAEKLFKPQELRVFDELPKDQRVTTVQDWFVPVAQPKPAQSQPEWLEVRQAMVDEVKHSVIGRLPFSENTTNLYEDAPTQQRFKISDSRKTVESFDVIVPMRSLCRVMLVRPEPNDDSRMVAFIPSLSTWQHLEELVAQCRVDSESVDRQAFFDACGVPFDAQATLAILTPEGTGPWHWDSTNKTGLHLRRSMLLAGWSIEGRQIAGVACALEHLKLRYPQSSLSLHSDHSTSMIALHAGLLESDRLTKVTLIELPQSYADGFNLMGILQRYDVRQIATALADLVPIEIVVSAKSDAKNRWLAESPYERAVRDLQSWPSQQWTVVTVKEPAAPEHPSP
jgi:hypothetical protein